MWRKLVELIVNVTVLPDFTTSPDGGQYIELRIPPGVAVAYTTDNRYFTDPSPLRSLQLTGETILKRIEPDRLAVLGLGDPQRYPGRKSATSTSVAAAKSILSKSSARWKNYLSAGKSALR